MYQVAVSNLVDKMQVLEITYKSMNNVKQKVVHVIDCEAESTRGMEDTENGNDGMLISLTVVII